MSQASSCCVPVLIPTHRPFWYRLVDHWEALRSGWRAAQARRERLQVEEELLGPDGLSPQMLRDIGFAAWQVDQAEARRAREVERWLW